MIPAAIGFIAIGRPLVELLLERGNFTQQDSDNVTGMLICLAIGLPAFSTFLYTCRAFYARRDTRTPFYLNLVENAINVALALPFLHWFGPVGPRPGVLVRVLLHRSGRPGGAPPAGRSSARPRRRPPVAARRRCRSGGRARDGARTCSSSVRRSTDPPILEIVLALVVGSGGVHSDRGVPPPAGFRTGGRAGAATTRPPNLEAVGRPRLRNRLKDPAASVAGRHLRGPG